MQYQFSDPIGGQQVVCQEPAVDINYLFLTPLEVTYTNTLGEIVTTSDFYFGYCLTPLRLLMLYLLALLGMVLIVVYLTRFRIVRATNMADREPQWEVDDLDEFTDVLDALSRESDSYKERRQ